VKPSAFWDQAAIAIAAAMAADRASASPRSSPKATAADIARIAAEVADCLDAQRLNRAREKPS
jgi:hypothetical protein